MKTFEELLSAHVAERVSSDAERAQQKRAEREYRAVKRVEDNEPCYLVYATVSREMVISYFKCDFGSRQGANHWATTNRLGNARIFTKAFLAVHGTMDADAKTLYHLYK